MPRFSKFSKFLEKDPAEEADELSTVRLSSLFDEGSQVVERTKIRSLYDWGTRMIGQVVFAKDEHGLIPAVVGHPIHGSAQTTPEWLKSSCWCRYLIQRHPCQESGVLFDVCVSEFDLCYLGKTELGGCEVLVTLVGLAEDHHELLRMFKPKQILSGVSQVERRVEGWLKWTRLRRDQYEIPPGLYKLLDASWNARSLSGETDKDSESDEDMPLMGAEVLKEAAAFVDPGDLSYNEECIVSEDALDDAVNMHLQTLDAVERASSLIQKNEEMRKQIFDAEVELSKLYDDKATMARMLASTKIQLSLRDQVKHFDGNDLDPDDRVRCGNTRVTFYMSNREMEQCLKSAANPRDAFGNLVMAAFSLHALLICDPDDIGAGGKGFGFNSTVVQDLARRVALYANKVYSGETEEAEPSDRRRAFHHKNAMWCSLQSVLKTVRVRAMCEL